MGDQVDLQEPGARVVPLGEGANRNLVLEPRAGSRDRRPAPRLLRAGRREQARQGRATRLPDEFIDEGRQSDLTALGESFQEFRHEGMEAMSADPTCRLPQDLGRAGHVWPVARGPSSPRAYPRRPGTAPEQTDGGLAMNPGNGDDLVQQAVLLRSTGSAIPLTLHDRVLPKTRSRHGMYELAFGNPNFESMPVDTTRCHLYPIDASARRRLDCGA
jgi:hypothetical protein